MKEIILSAIGDTIKNFEEKIAQAQTLWEKVQIFFSTPTKCGFWSGLSCLWE
ncbi:MAG: hypothetical protein L6V85_04485 [Clostridiales bacterium]|nr:MAG: hypothetical protein L6V85_04485 [Clostridiales bacterium]